MIIDGEFSFGLAVPADDADLRRLVATTPMPGGITVTFEREPNYFLGCSLMGRSCDVLVARHLGSGELAGVMCRGIRPVFVNGTEMEVGNVGQVRIAEKFRGRRLLERGLRLFVERSRPELPNYGVMAAGNTPARRAMVDHPPRGFVVHDLETFTTLGMILRRPSRRRRNTGVAARPRPSELAEIVAFLRDQGRRRQYFPAYDIADLTGVATRGFEPDRDLLVVRRTGRIAGVVGVWDQTAFKQTIVQSYDEKLSRLRPWYDRVARLAGIAPLPRPGEQIAAAFAAFLCVAGDDPRVMCTLLAGARAEAAVRGFAYLMIGLSERDPLFAVARRSAHIPYRASLQTSAWRPGVVGRDLHAELDGRPAYVEIAML